MFRTFLPSGCKGGGLNLETYHCRLANPILSWPANPLPEVVMVLWLSPEPSARPWSYKRQAAPLRNAEISRIGGFPKSLLYSRLNCVVLSYPTRSATVLASTG